MQLAPGGYYHRQSASHRGNAFTLIELLVVIAIIAVVAAILFPVFATARENARKASCLSNCKQMGTALMMYQQDYDGGVPTYSEYWYERAVLPDNVGPNTPDRYWDAKLFPYVQSGQRGTTTSVTTGGIWRCPSSPVPEGERTYGVSMGWFYNTHPSATTTYRYLHDSEIARPAQVVFAGDSGPEGRLFRNYDGQYCLMRYRTVPPAEYGRFENPEVHGGGANYVYFDGHAKWTVMRSMYPCPTTAFTGAFPAESRNKARCIWGQLFAATEDERKAHRDLAIAAGVPCPE
jgi:prepilin-type N-terminal cleavage/methylation domain